MIKRLTLSKAGKEFLASLRPLDNPYWELKMVNEMIKIVKREEQVFPSNFATIDIQEIIDKVKQAQILDTEELLKISSALLVIKAVRKNITNIDEIPSIKELIKTLGTYDDIIPQIQKCIAEDGSIKDSASERLRQLRIEYRQISEQIRKRVESFVNANRIYLQEPIATLRDGRHVFPVKATHRSQIKGIVHSVSSSAATYFVEPEEFVSINNDLREAKEKEQEEINRILRNLTLSVYEQIEKIEQDILIMAHLDSLYARAVFACQYNAHVIYPSQELEIKLIAARHPLIDRQRVVPVDMILPSQKCGLVLTGPNTGGKTVSLKTTGLFCSMMMAGFPVPCDENSKLPAFSKIVVDVGDEQDIKQNLSTFSSHIVNVIKALEVADSRTLVLLDELGSGTDPVEGAALGLAIIQKLKECGCKFIITTHLTPIKIYAASDERLVSASVEFDPQTLEPTFRILMGVPGASHAFEIARKLGLDEAVLQQAQKFMGQEYMNVEKTIEKYQEQTVILREKIHEVETERIKLEKLKAEYEAKYDELRKRKIEELDEELKKTYNHIKEMKKQIDEAISNVKKKNQDLESLRTASKLFEQQSRIVKDFEFVKDQAQMSSDQPLSVGDAVRLKNGRAVGRIIGMKGDKYVVDFNGIRIEARLNALVKSSLENKEQPIINFQSTHSNLIKPEVDVRGLTVDEAEPVIEDFIDKLILSDFKIGYVIHGKGTGRLAVGIWEILRRDGRVKKYRFGTPGEGGTGVTVVEV